MDSTPSVTCLINGRKYSGLAINIPLMVASESERSQLGEQPVSHQGLERCDELSPYCCPRLTRCKGPHQGVSRYILCPKRFQEKPVFMFSYEYKGFCCKQNIRISLKVGNCDSGSQEYQKFRTLQSLQTSRVQTTYSTYILQSSLESHVPHRCPLLDLCVLDSLPISEDLQPTFSKSLKS